MSQLSDYIGITDEELELLELDILGNCGSSREMVYSYYFTVPLNTSKDILNKTGWQPGEIIYIPPSIFLHDQNYDDISIDAEEEEWILANPQSARLSEFLVDLNWLRLKISKNDIFSTQSDYRMGYSYCITLFEAFLSESAKHAIATNQQALKNAASYFSRLETAQKFNLEQVINLDLAKHVLGLVSCLTFHNLKTASKFFSTVLAIKLDLSPLRDIITMRHDIVHRNGKRIDGSEIHITMKYLSDVFNIVEDAAKFIHHEVMKLDGVR